MAFMGLLAQTLRVSKTSAIHLAHLPGQKSLNPVKTVFADAKQTTGSHTGTPASDSPWGALHSHFLAASAWEVKHGLDPA